MIDISKGVILRGDTIHMVVSQDCVSVKFPRGLVCHTLQLQYCNTTNNSVTFMDIIKIFPSKYFITNIEFLNIPFLYQQGFSFGS